VIHPSTGVRHTKPIHAEGTELWPALLTPFTAVANLCYNYNRVP
jgi:hypothetical protein